MGGIADYCGSLVLQLPLAEAALAAVQAADDGMVRVVSLDADAAVSARVFEILQAELTALIAGDYAQIRDWFRGCGDSAWAAYALGVVIALARQREVDLGGGMRILIHSRVPEGKGVSSSAALEVAVLQAVAHLLGASLAGEELARLCQLAENHVVGAPCGIMDQMTAALGRANHLLALLCQPAEVQGFVPVPAELRFWGIDSGIRHAVSGADYTSVRTGAFMGYRILVEQAGLAAQGPDAHGAMTIDDPQWRGYLANLTPAEFRRRFADAVPHEMLGADFLEQYGGISDIVTRVDPRRTYAVYRPTVHPIWENDRVRRFGRLLGGGIDEAALREMGELMYGSHASYSACGLGAEGTDLLVELVRRTGPDGGLYGAKITGGGSGGTVAILGRADAADRVADIATEYTRQTGRQTTLFRRSSSGASPFGVLQINLRDPAE